jgi:ABC-2 type transport system permease protein
VQPLHPWHRDLLQNVAYKALTLTVMLPAAALLAWHFEACVDGAPWAMALFPLAVLLGFLVRFVFEWALAMLAFWVTDTSGLNDLYWTVGLFLSGRMAPLDLLPGWVQGIADALPFRWTVAFPAQLLLGRVTPAQALHGLGLQAVWLALGAAVVTVAWRRASARYSAVGA